MIFPPSFSSFALRLLSLPLFPADFCSGCQQGSPRELRRQQGDPNQTYCFVCLRIYAPFVCCAPRLIISIIDPHGSSSQPRCPNAFEQYWTWHLMNGSMKRSIPNPRKHVKEPFKCHVECCIPNPSPIINLSSSSSLTTARLRLRRVAHRA